MTATNRPWLPGGVALSRINAYETAAPDGHAGGTPHVHLTCTECYVVLRGRGLLQTLTPAGYMETELAPGRVVWFEPGVIHRDLNISGDLEFLVIMENAGLPEAGDQILTFPSEVLSDAIAYGAAVDLGNDEAEAAGRARHRRDLAVEGFNRLRDAAAENPAQLEAFYRAALERVRPDLETWRQRWEQNLAPLHTLVEQRLANLERGEFGHALTGRLGSVEGTDREQMFGMCGRLTPLFSEPER